MSVCHFYKKWKYCKKMTEMKNILKTYPFFLRNHIKNTQTYGT